MYYIICQKPAHFLSVQMALVSPFFQMFIVFGMYNFGYGMGYTNCTLETGLIPPQNCPGIYLEFGAHCGFRTDHAVNLYTSPDLENWTFVADVFPLEARPEGIYFRHEFLTIPDILLYVGWS